MDAPEVVADVRVEDVVASGVHRPPDGLQRHERAPARPEAERRGLEAGLEDRLDDELHRHLRHPILHRRNAQRPQLPVGLGYVPPQHGRRFVGACVELVAQLREEPVHAVLLHRLERDPVHARGALVATDAPPRFPQDVTPVDTVVQRVEAALPMPLGCSVELALESSDFVDGR